MGFKNKLALFKNFKVAIIFVGVLVIFSKLHSQKKFTLSGYIRDTANGESVSGINVVFSNTNFAASTNGYGFFSITADSGVYYLDVASNMFEMVQKKIYLNKNLFLTIHVSKIPEVSVRARRNDNVSKIDLSTQKITSQTIKKIPAFLGEADVIKSIQLLPGVSTVGEGATGFNVRGGGIDQNLVLMDEAPVFNSAHLFGFFSIFNPDGVKDVQLIKGGIPANYGGRLSSVLDVRMKDGNNKKFDVNGGVGTIFSRLTIEGPIKKNQSSFMLAARRSYIDILAKPFLKGDLKNSNFAFYDYQAKVNYEKGKNKVYISGYLGDDVFGAPNAFSIKWGNGTITGRWNHIFSKKLFANFTTYYSRYRYNILFENRDASFNWKSFIINSSAKADFTYTINSKNTLGFGGQSTYYIFKPGNAVAKNKNETSNFSLPDKFALENAVYITNDYNPNKKLGIRYGLRVSDFYYLGKGNAYYFKNRVEPGTRAEFDRKKYFETNKKIAYYKFLEPRLGLKYQFNKLSSIKAGYNRMVQNLHLISNTAASVPFDVWQPTTNNIKPEICDQYTIGYFRNFGKNADFETSVETYYKKLHNQVDYIDGADLLLNEYLEADLINGTGRTYGLELYIKKNTGKLTGWISYTLSRSERLTNGINNYNWYPTRFDRLHNAAVVLQYNLNKKWDFAANFVLSSGTPTTFYSSTYTIQGYIVPDPGGQVRNNVRNPYYHRLDLSATYHVLKRKHWESDWVFSCYNVYNRRNPFSIYFATDYQKKGNNAAIRYSVIGSFVPAISYNFKWK